MNLLGAVQNRHICLKGPGLQEPCQIDAAQAKASIFLVLEHVGVRECQPSETGMGRQRERVREREKERERERERQRDRDRKLSHPFTI